MSVHKELIVSVGTSEPDAEATLRSSRMLPGHVLFQHEGCKVALKIEQLKEALSVLEEFIDINGKEGEAEVEVTVTEVPAITIEHNDDPRNYGERYEQ